MPQQLFSLAILAAIALVSYLESPSYNLFAQSRTFWLAILCVAICGFFIWKQRHLLTLPQPYWPSLFVFVTMAATLYAKSTSYDPFGQGWPFWLCLLGICLSGYFILERHLRVRASPPKSA
jgi:tellurite resistance protein TehA-like permease